MKYPHSFPLWRSNGELLPGGAPSRLVLSSVCTKWNDVVVEQHHFPSSELADVMHKQHMIAINVGHCITWEFKKEGRLHHAFKARGAISCFPSHQPFSAWLKVEKGRFANFLFLTLGLADVIKLRPGEVIFISGAAGAVGSIACQIAKLMGADRAQRHRCIFRQCRRRPPGCGFGICEDVRTVCALRNDLWLRQDCEWTFELADGN